MIAALVLSAALHEPAAPPPNSVHVGTRTLYRCDPQNDNVEFPGYCGVMSVPLDWNDPNTVAIRVRYEWVPSASPGATETIVAVEGGPGFPTTGSGRSYVGIFKPLLSGRNLLMMDERGTGASTPIHCEPLQRIVTTDVIGDLPRAAGVCGGQLNHTFPTRDRRGFVHASDLFTTQQSVRDLVAIIDALQLPPVDLYGDSYGTFFAQAFAANHPELVRSLVLDSAYPLDQDRFDPPVRDEIRFAYDAVCARSLACSAAAPGASLERIRRLARRLAASPFRRGRRTYDPGDLDAMLGWANQDLIPFVYRDLDAAARAWLDRGDAVPLARLFAWSEHLGDEPSAYTQYSVGMQVATECTAYRSPFDMRATVDERLRQYRAAVSTLPASMFDPIANTDALANASENFDECLHWPAPVHDDPLVAHALPLLPPGLPALIISGDLDVTTPPGDARLAAEQLGPSARLVSIPNAGHGPTFTDGTGCAQRIVRAFIDSPDAALDTSCTEHEPEVRAVGVFPMTLADQPPAASRSGDRGSTADARLAALAVGAIGDAIQSARFAQEHGHMCSDDSFCGRGLRGGSFLANIYASGIVLVDIAYSRDTTVRGTVSIESAPPLYAPVGSVVTANVRIRTKDRSMTERLSVRWDERRPHALAAIDGWTSNGRAIHEVMPAP